MSGLRLPIQSLSVPEKTRTMSAVASATPSTMPTANAEAPSPVTMNTGSRLWIISDETSMKRLPKPRIQTVRGTSAARGSGVGDGGAAGTGLSDAEGYALAAPFARVVDPVEDELSGRFGAHIELKIRVGGDARAHLGAEDLFAVVAADERVDDVL